MAKKSKPKWKDICNKPEPEKPEEEYIPPPVREAMLRAERAANPPKPLITKPPVDLDACSDEDIERVLKAIIFFDGRRVLDREGRGLPLDQLDDATALGLAGFEVEELYERAQERGAPRINVGVLKKFKQADRARAAETLWKKQGKMSGSVEQGGRQKDRLNELEDIIKQGPCKS